MGLKLLSGDLRTFSITTSFWTYQVMVSSILGVSLGFLLASLGTVFFAAQLWIIKIRASNLFCTAGTISNLYACVYILFNDFRMMFWLLLFSNEDINLDSSYLSPLTPELHYADSVVVLSGPDLCVHLPLAVLPAQLASFRQKRAKSDSAGAAKKTQKRKGQAVAQNDSSTQDRHVEAAPPSANNTELNNKTNHEVHHWLHRDHTSVTH